jgi:hypothetical protein
MKIFITKNYPTATFYYKVLRFLRSHATEKELKYYVEEICAEAREGK